MGKKKIHKNEHIAANSVFIQYFSFMDGSGVLVSDGSFSE